MKKIILLLLLFFYSIQNFSQLSQNFEDAGITVPNGFPAGWLVADNGVGSSASWEIIDNASAVISGTKSAYINRHEIGIGNTSEDWLITPLTTIPTNGQLKFATRQSITGDQGTIYQIRISSGTSQSNFSSYTILNQWTETQLNQISTVAEDKKVDFPVANFGTNVYIAFVRIYTQPTSTLGGDRWIIDDVTVSEKCLGPLGIAANNITATSAQITWNASAGSLGYELEIIPATMSPTGIPSMNTAINSAIIVGLTPNTCFKIYIRSNCSTGNFSDWIGPYNVCTPALGISCTNPIEISSLPYSTDNNTVNFGNTLAGPQTASCISGAVNYQSGNDVFYKYTTTENCNVSFTLNSAASGSSLFIYPSCAGVTGPCLAAVGNTSNDARVINYNVILGTTYIIVISSSALSPTIGYNLVVQCEGCQNKPTNLTVSNVIPNGATLGWNPPAGAPSISYEVAVQFAGSPIPAGSGNNTLATNYVVTDLNPQNSYQYWVRSECSPGVFSAWAGPKLFVNVTCPKPINQSVSVITTTSATLSWVEAGSAAQWEVLLLAAPNAVAPSNPGINPVITPFDILIQNITGQTAVTPSLQPSTIYYYYVRTVCQPGNDKSVWTGPFIFNTITCNNEQKCIYRFLLTNTINNSWNGGRMQVRQNGIVVASLGTGGVNNQSGIAVALCNNVPFDLFWSVAGTQPQQIGVRIENPFNDTVYLKQPGEGTPLNVLYSDTTLGNCAPPTCPSPQDFLASTQNATAANLSWEESGSAVQWEVYVTSAGSPAPLNGTPLNTGNSSYYLANTNTNFIVTSLGVASNRDFYVRAICTLSNLSTWTKIKAQSSDKIVLMAFVDSNGNGLKDTNESPFEYGSFKSIKNNIEVSNYWSGFGGTVTIYESNAANSYNFTYEIDVEYQPFFAGTPTNFNGLTVTEGSGTQTLYFPITVTQSYTDVAIFITPLSSPRPGFSFMHKISYKNYGTLPTSGVITYIKDNSNITFTNITPAATTTSSNTLTFNFENLLPGQTHYIYVTMLVAAIPTVNLGDIVTNTASITSTIGEISTSNNSFTSVQTVLGSYDPNDKTEARGSNVPIGQFTQENYLFYTIRFQNSGTASAEIVKIEDILASQFNFASIRMMSASHDYTMERINNKLIWTFNNINLPAESVNEPGSHGYVTFKIKLNPGFVVGDVIANTAQIYFDFNPAIITNTFQTTFVPNLSVGSLDGNNLVVYPNPAKEMVYVQLKNSTENLQKVVIYDMIGKAILSLSANNTQEASLNVGTLSSGVYMIEITTDSNLKQTKKFIVN